MECERVAAAAVAIAGLENFPVTQWHRARDLRGVVPIRVTLVCERYDLDGINLICWRDRRHA